MDDMYTQMEEAALVLLDAVIDAWQSVMDCFKQALSLIRPTFEWIVDLHTTVAYEFAKTKYPKWVHYAKHGKSKRIRKKYNDRIMRLYMNSVALED